MSQPEDAEEKELLEEHKFAQPNIKINPAYHAWLETLSPKEKEDVRNLEYRAVFRTSRVAFFTTRQAIREMLLRSNGYCEGFDCEPHKVEISELTLAHLYPLKLGGVTRIKNIRLLCGECNYKEGATPNWKLIYKAIVENDAKMHDFVNLHNRNAFMAGLKEYADKNNLPYENLPAVMKEKRWQEERDSYRQVGFRLVTAKNHFQNIVKALLKRDKEWQEQLDSYEQIGLRLVAAKNHFQIAAEALEQEKALREPPTSFRNVVHNTVQDFGAWLKHEKPRRQKVTSK